MHTHPLTATAALRQAQELLATATRHPRRDAELLLRFVLGCDRTWLLANPDAPLAPGQYETYKQLLHRRAQHEPMQYILGEQEFYGLRFAVTPAVLIPRPETEHLVEAVLTHLPQNSNARIVDVGTGSGAIAVTLAHQRPLVQVTALDLSPPSLQIAQTNAETHNVAHRIRFVESDLLAAVAGERFDVIVSNPPYIASSEELEPQVAQWEPHTALFAGPDGLAIYRRLIPQARRHLSPHGLLALEFGAGQQEALASLLREDPDWGQSKLIADLQGIARVMIVARTI